MGLFDIFKKKKSVKRKYDGASRGKRLSSWGSDGKDANAELDTSLKTLRERSRDLRRNNPYARRAIDVTTANVIGKGISTQFSNDNAQELWKDWAGTQLIDFDGKNNLKGLQRMVMDAVQESGEVLIRRRVIAGLTFPFQYQILESDFLDTTKTSSSNGNRIIQGIEFDKLGKLLGYHIYETHPGSIDTGLSLSSNFISKDEIMHIFRQERPGQIRGVPWLAPIMVRLRDLVDFEDAQLVRQKIAACFTAFVQDISADCMDSEASTSGDFGEILEPGIIEELPPGKTVTFADPPSTENYKEFTSAQIRAAGLGYGLSFESISGDLSETNYSSARMGRLDMDRNMDAWREFIIISQMLNPIVADFRLMVGLIGSNGDAGKAVHTPPMKEIIDPTKEIPAMIKGIRAGLQSRSEVIRSMGKDPKEIMKEIEQDNKDADDKDLILDSDPRYTNIAGKAQDEPKDENEQANKD